MKKIKLTIITLSTILALASCSKDSTNDIKPKSQLTQNQLDSIAQAKQDSINHIEDSLSAYYGIIYSKRSYYTGITYTYYVTYKNCKSNNLNEVYQGNSSWGLSSSSDYYKPYGTKIKFSYTW